MLYLLDLLAQGNQASQETWLFGAVFMMVVFNIIWKPIERKLFPNDSLKDLCDLSEESSKKIQELYSWHDDKDVRSGQHRWKFPPDLLEILDKQNELLAKINDTQNILFQEIRRLNENVVSLADKTETMTKSFDRFLIKMKME